MDSSIISYFRKINNIHDTNSKKAVDLYNVKKEIIKDFDDNVLAFLVQIESDQRYLILTDSTKERTKNFISKPNELVYSGDMIIWENVHWIVTKVDPNKDIFSKGEIQECLSSLKWKDSLESIKETYFTLTKDTQTGLGIDEGKVLITPTEVRYLTIQKNIDTEKIKKQQRFIFDGDRAWKVTSVSDLKSGIIELTLIEEELNKNLDNLDLRIANYTSRTTSNTNLI